MEYISVNLNGQYGIGKQVKLDKEDYEKIKHKKLCCISSGYVMIWDKKAQYLHRWLFNLQVGEKVVIDHIDRDILNCTRENLRKCTTGENMQNREKLKYKGENAKSKYKGVWLVTYKNGDILWKAVATKDKIKYYLGYFKTEEEAALAYNVKTKELYTNFASLNIIV